MGNTGNRALRRSYRHYRVSCKMIAAVLMMAVTVTAASVAQLRRFSLRSLSFSALRRFSSADVFSFGMVSPPLNRCSGSSKKHFAVRRIIFRHPCLSTSARVPSKGGGRFPFLLASATMHRAIALLKMCFALLTCFPVCVVSLAFPCYNGRGRRCYFD